MYRINGRAVVRVEADFPHAFKTRTHKNMAYEYTVNASNKIGRPVKETECVHHIDGDPDNNDPINLMVFVSRADHTKFHKLGSDTSMLVELEDGVFGLDEEKASRYAECSYCGKEFIFKKENHKNSAHNVYCCADCCNADRAAKSRSPGREELEKLINTLSMSAIGRLYGVSVNSVKKWLVKLDLK